MTVTTMWPTVEPTVLDAGNFARPQLPETTERSSQDLQLSEKELRAAVRNLADRHDNPTASVRNWGVALRLLLANLVGLSFEEAATVVGIAPSNLERILHGALRVQPSQHERIDRMLKLTIAIEAVLERPEIPPWFRTAVPALKGITPLEAARQSRLDQLERVVASYFDPGYA